jgi:SAM-dependent methyltransferase
VTARWRRNADTRLRRRQTLNAVAGDYDRVRPRYPSEVFDELCNLANLSPGARILEIGCGTGQATLPLAQRGFSVVAVELGQELAAATRERTSAFPAVEVANTNFEEWQARDRAFDAVVSFAAIHWIDPDVRYAKAAQLLRPGGALGVFDWEDTVSEDGDDFFVAVEEDYAAVVPEWRITPPSPHTERDWLKADIEASGRFGVAQERRFVWSVNYSASDYVAFLNTRSSYRILNETKRTELFGRIQRRIEGRPSQAVRKEFLGVLAVALAS